MPGAEERFDAGWVAAQRRICSALERPARLGFAACCVLALTAWGAWLASVIGPPLGASALIIAAVGAAACTGSAARGRRRLARTLEAERERVAADNEAQARALAAAQRQHASEYRAWQRRIAVFERQPSWFALALPAEIDRVDVAGGTLAGWSAVLTTIAVPRLGDGGEVTVIDLTEGSVAADLISLARRSDPPPLVWVLPGDLPALDLGTGLDAASLADVLALAAGAAAEADRSGARPAERSGADQAADCALLERVLGVLEGDPRIAQVTAALRVLAQVGDPHEDVRSGLLTPPQIESLGRLFGRGAGERVVTERAFMLESRLRRLDALGAGRRPRSRARLRVAALDRRCGAVGNRVIGSYLVAALTQVLRQAPPGRLWAHTLCLFGAERLGADLLDRLTAACETSRTGLVLGYRTIPAGVRERLGRGTAATAFMRLGNGDDARAASELIGTEHRLVLGQLTDTVGSSVTDTVGDSYTSTAGTADSFSDSVSVSRSTGSSRGRGRSRPGGAGPFGDFNRSSSLDSSHSYGESESVSLTAGINASTSWGVSTSRALGGSTSTGRTMQRSRELLVEAESLQRLPASAVIVAYPASDRRMVVLADANPAIAALPDAELP